jgi:3-isopropylmalate/(R)-2-methylmalate dehydratase large subunit
MGKTIAEKILSAHCNGDVAAGDVIAAAVDLAMATDGSGPLAIKLFGEMDFTSSWNPDKVLMVLDHYVPCPNDKVAKLHNEMRAFCEAGNGRLFDLGEGICHQLLPENGYVKPGDLIVGADSHSVTYGALNALGTGVGSSDLAAAMGTGRLWFQVPQSMKIVLNGQFSNGVTAKDLALFIIGELSASGADYRSIEFHGEALDGLDVADRMTICNMMVETGAKCSIMPFDSVAKGWVQDFRWDSVDGVAADPDAYYTDEIQIDLNSLLPQIAKPHQVDNVIPITSIEETPIHMVVIGTCTNGRLKDLEVAAQILKDNGKASGLELLIVPASRQVYSEAAKKGILEIFSTYGAMILPPGCGPCCGSSPGIPSDGENVLSTANRNFLGRMGNVNADIYLGSPLSAIAAAVTGKITDPRGLM